MTPATKQRILGNVLGNVTNNARNTAKTTRSSLKIQQRQKTPLKPTFKSITFDTPQPSVKKTTTDTTNTNSASLIDDNKTIIRNNNNSNDRMFCNVQWRNRKGILQVTNEAILFHPHPWTCPPSQTNKSKANQKRVPYTQVKSYQVRTIGPDSTESSSSTPPIQQQNHLLRLKIRKPKDERSALFVLRFPSASLLQVVETELNQRLPSSVIATSSYRTIHQALSSVTPATITSTATSHYPVVQLGGSISGSLTLEDKNLIFAPTSHQHLPAMKIRWQRVQDLQIQWDNQLDDDEPSSLKVICHSIHRFHSGSKPPTNFMSPLKKQPPPILELELPSPEELQQLHQDMTDRVEAHRLRILSHKRNVPSQPKPDTMESMKVFWWHRPQVRKRQNSQKHVTFEIMSAKSIQSPPTKPRPDQQPLKPQRIFSPQEPTQEPTQGPVEFQVTVPVRRRRSRTRRLASNDIYSSSSSSSTSQTSTKFMSFLVGVMVGLVLVLFPHQSASAVTTTTASSQVVTLHESLQMVLSSWGASTSSFFNAVSLSAQSEAVSANDNSNGRDTATPTYVEETNDLLFETVTTGMATWVNLANQHFQRN